MKLFFEILSLTTFTVVLVCLILYVGRRLCLAAPGFIRACSTWTARRKRQITLWVRLFSLGSKN
jgi:hypothetical protein